jgi:hypothetical protein
MIQVQTRPRVLLIGNTCGDRQLDCALREIADVTVLPGREYDEERQLIEQAINEKGPFDMFGVSPANIFMSAPFSLAHIVGLVHTRRQVPDEVG